jgi:dTDP-4-dehydrorhamnose reductase
LKVACLEDIAFYNKWISVDELAEQGKNLKNAGLAKWIWAVAEKPDMTGVFHWTDAGVASWYDFAVAIQELGIEKGLLIKAIPITAILGTDYPTTAKRPSFSVMDKTSAESAVGIKTVHWRQQLSSMMDGLKNGLKGGLKGEKQKIVGEN